jgi:uncharacterized membrane protein YgcG
MADNSGLFRQKALDNLSTPDELTDRLKVTNPSVWAVLAAVIVLLAGLIAWACVGTLPTKADAQVVVLDGTASVLVSDPYTVGAGMPAIISGQECTIESVATDDYGRTVGVARVDLADGSYRGSVVVDETRAIDFLLQSDLGSQNGQSGQGDQSGQGGQGDQSGQGAKTSQVGQPAPPDQPAPPAQG